MSRRFLSDADVQRLAKEYFGQGKPTEADYLAYAIDEFELNSWCATAFPDMLGRLRGGQGWLTEKQRASLVKFIAESGMYIDDVKNKHLERGYADRSDQEVLRDSGTGTQTAQSTKMAAAGDSNEDDDIPYNKTRPKPNYFDDMDDDIPF